MENIMIVTLEDYLRHINGFSDVFFYRGLSDISYDLIPAAGRFGIADESTQKQFEQQLLSDFRLKAPLYSDVSPENDLEWMILAQHHGIPTRLLDWSFNPMVALFFAVENAKETDAVIYESYKSSGQLNPVSYSDIFSEAVFTQIIPNRTLNRYAHQESLFTICPKPSQPDYTKIYRKFVIPCESKKLIRWKLRRIGITRAFIYPGLDSLAHDIVEVKKLEYAPYFS